MNSHIASAALSPFKIILVLFLRFIIIISPLGLLACHDTAESIIAGGYHTCELKTDGSMLCWGDNRFGQLGIGTIEDSVLQPVYVTGVTDASKSTDTGNTDTDWKSLAAGVEHNCAIKNDGTLWCWGGNDFGLLGVGSLEVDSLGNGKRFPIPMPVVSVSNGAATITLADGTTQATDTDWSSVDVILYNTCATKTDGTLWCWGSNHQGQLGINDATITQKAIPAQVAEVSDSSAWVQVVTGNQHACARKLTGTVWCWGSNRFGQVGIDDDTLLTQLIPTQITTPVGLVDTDWAILVAGTAHTCALTSDNSLWCWGNNFEPQTGFGTFKEGNYAPVQEVTTATDWTDVHAGAGFSCARKSDKTVWCWGINAHGELGIADDTNVTQLTPMQITSPAGTTQTTWEQVSVGGNHSCVLSSTGDRYCWGDNIAGQLGNEDASGKGIPTALTPSPYGATTVSVWASVEGGNDDSCGIKNDGTLWCWGDQNKILGLHSKLGDGTQIDRQFPTPVSPATDSVNTISVAIPGGPYGVSTVTNTDTDWASVAPGDWHHSCAIKTDHSLWCWGQDSNGQTGNGDEPEGTTPIAVASTIGATTPDSDWQLASLGYKFTCASKLNGSLWCWGLNSDGQMGDGSPAGNGAANSPQTKQFSHYVPGAVASVIPSNVSTDTDWGPFSSGYLHVCAIKSGGNLNGTLWCWGGNDRGELGIGTWGFNTNVIVPTPTVSVSGSAISVPVAGGTAMTDNDWATVASGRNASCAIKTNGSLWCWGIVMGSNTPAQVDATAGHSWLMTAVGDGHACALRSDNTIWCKSLNNFGQLGNNSTLNSFTLVQEATLATDWIAVTNGGNHSCGRKVDGQVLCWGRNNEGGLGNSTAWYGVPQKVIGLSSP